MTCRNALRCHTAAAAQDNCAVSVCVKMDMSAALGTVSTVSIFAAMIRIIMLSRTPGSRSATNPPVPLSA